MVFDLGDVGKDVVAGRDIIAERLAVPKVDAMDVGHNVGHASFSSCPDEFGVSTRRSAERQGNDEKVLALEGRNQRLLVIIINRGDSDSLRENASVDSTSHGC